MHFGPVNFKEEQGGPSFRRPHSVDTAEVVVPVDVDGGTHTPVPPATGHRGIGYESRGCPSQVAPVFSTVESQGKFLCDRTRVPCKVTEVNVKVLIILPETGLLTSFWGEGVKTTTGNVRLFTRQTFSDSPIRRKVPDVRGVFTFLMEKGRHSHVVAEVNAPSTYRSFRVEGGGGSETGLRPVGLDVPRRALRAEEESRRVPTCSWPTS